MSADSKQKTIRQNRDLDHVYANVKRQIIELLPSAFKPFLQWSQMFFFSFSWEKKERNQNYILSFTFAINMVLHVNLHLSIAG